MIHLDHRDSRPVYVQIGDGFKAQIAAGVLQPGDKMPSVRELAYQLAINPNTIQRAYRELEHEGWIYSEPCRGMFVATKSRQDPLWEELDRVVRKLTAKGISRQAIIEKLEEGEKDHAENV